MVTIDGCLCIHRFFEAGLEEIRLDREGSPKYAGRGRVQRPPTEVGWPLIDLEANCVRVGCEFKFREGSEPNRPLRSAEFAAQRIRVTMGGPVDIEIPHLTEFVTKGFQ